MKGEIFKLQRPLMTNDPNAATAVLYYNQKRTVEGIIDMTDEEITEVFGDEPKVFVRAKIVEKKKERSINIEGSAPWQDW